MSLFRAVGWTKSYGRKTSRVAMCCGVGEARGLFSACPLMGVVVLATAAPRGYVFYLRAALMAALAFALLLYKACTSLV